ncbi:transposase-like zinc-binding domain-containing protein [Nostoc sp. LEGE 12447]|uniref:IS1/IS1595 family N-terminal zinc-binding domain-containing protein n=1 Tax=Nostoc sp. LEGE 12447 TaxID=1828640 RepID=UPI003A0FF6FD
MKCPRCSSDHICKNGRQRGKQNYIWLTISLQNVRLLWISKRFSIPKLCCDLLPIFI